LTEAILQMQSSIFTVANLNLTSFSEQTNEDVFFLMYNAFNDFYQALLTASNLYVAELSDRSSQNLEITLILFILSIAALLVVVLILFPVVRSVNRQKDKVLSLFCEIGDSNVRLLSLRCEKFINKLQTTEENANDNDMDSNEELDQLMAQKTGLEDADDEYLGMVSGGSGKRRKNAKSNSRTDKLLYGKVIFVLLVAEAYYAYAYSMMIQY